MHTARADTEEQTHLPKSQKNQKKFKNKSEEIFPRRTI